VRSSIAALLAIAALACESHATSRDLDARPSSSSTPSSSPPPSSPSRPPPPYDLPFDIHVRTELARSHFGDYIAVDVEDSVFLFVAPPFGLAFVPSLALVRRALPALYSGRFSTRPTRPITIYLFEDAGSYEAFCHARYGHPCTSPLGFYESEAREIVADQHYGVTTVLHELVHAILEADFPEAPRWLSEAISAMYETPVISGAEIHGATGWRLPWLRSALQSPARHELASLDALFSMRPDAFQGPDALTAYSVARFACLWLDSPSQDRLWRFYQMWRDHFGEDPTGEKSFAAAVGQTPHEANDAWRKWVRSL
jgi:hypothetical protein